MIETPENIVYNPDYPVEVQALAMVRDGSTGGWIPLAGGGLSTVTVRQYTIPSESGEEETGYVIHAQRIKDDKVILSCYVETGMRYNKVTPSFCHWYRGDCRLGLTFQALNDAKFFDEGLIAILDELDKGNGEEPSHSRNRSPSELEIEETLELPVPDVGYRSAPDSSSRDNPKATPQEQAAQMSHFFNIKSESGSPTQSEKYGYLHLAAGQEHTCSDAEGTKLAQQDSSSGVKTKVAEAAPQNEAKPSKKDKKISGRHLCRYCQEIYVEEDNRRGACEYAPDCVRNTIDEVACVRAARCMMYHCMADEEGEFAQHPCQCTCEDNSTSRWTGIALLSIFFPCLCLYPPLRSCHWCCSRAGLCGGRHRPAS